MDNITVCLTGNENLNVKAPCGENSLWTSNSNMLRIVSQAYKN